MIGRNGWKYPKISIGLEEDLVLFVHFGDVSIPSYWDVQQSFKTCTVSRFPTKMPYVRFQAFVFLG